MKALALLPLLLAAGPARGADPVTLEQVREEIRKELGAQTKPRSNPSVFNPAMGVSLDAVARHTRAGQGQFDFRSAELSLGADVDPKARLYAVLVGSPDAFGVEEAAFVTTALPGLTVRGGRYFANFGRMGKFHDHELPFTERTSSLDSFIGGESQTEGVEAAHLFRLPFFLQGTLGIGNKLGADNERLKETTPAAQDGHKAGRPLSAFTYGARLFAYAPLGDDWGLDLGASAALTPRHYYVGGARADEGNNARLLSAADLTLRWEPLKDNLFRKALWSTEVFRNNERRRSAVTARGAAVNDAAGNALFANTRKTAWGGVSVIDWRFSRRFGGGAFADYAEDLDNRAKSTKTFGAFLNLFVSEVHRIRFQLARARNNDSGRADMRGMIQYTAVIGTHAHAFKDR